MTNYEFIKKLMKEGAYTYIEATNIVRTFTGQDFHILNPEEECSKEADSVIGFLQENKNYPYEYLIGEAYFIDLTLRVSESVLIPRPETEDLALLIVNENKDKENLSVLDLGTGSGAIIIYLAFHLDPSCFFFASDISEEALFVASENIRNNKRNISLIHSDFLDFAIASHKTFDLIVSNPPYIAADEPIGEEIKYEPPSALFAAENGMEPYKKILKNLDVCLRPNGAAYFEISSMKVEQLKKILDEEYADLFSYRFLQDRYMRDRFLVLKKTKLS